MVKATKRFKEYSSEDEGDYGDVPAEYAKADPGPTYDHELRSGEVVSETRKPMTYQQLLKNVLAEAVSFAETPKGNPTKATVPTTKCAVCGGDHHPASKHTAKALSAENNIGEAENNPKPEHKEWKVIDMTNGRHVDTVKAPNQIAAKKAASKKGHDKRFHTCLESEVPAPKDLMKAKLGKPLGKQEVLDELGEGKTNKGPKWDGNKLTIKTTQADIKRKSASAMGQPPPKKVILSKKDKPAKYKPKFDMTEETDHDCPNCGSADHLNFHQFDHGTDRETGYSDSGEGFHCGNCGEKGHADDTVRKPKKPAFSMKELEAAQYQVNAGKKAQAGSLWSKLKKG